MTGPEFQRIAHEIPNESGIYKYLDEKGNLLYVGKAKHLRKRVSSYFGKNPSSWKTRELVTRIKKIEFTIVDTEQDAFFLENALIKEHQPRFNIDLKDDKTYPFIVIKKEPFPRIFLTRKKMADGSEYLGPFTSVGRVRELLDFIRTLIPLRTCKLNLSDNNIQKKKYKVCLEYHLGNCKGPCEGLQSPADYESDLTQIRNLLKGNLGPVIRQFTTTMNQYAQQLAFEKAEQIRKKLDHLESYRAHSVIVGNEALHADIFALERDHETAFVSCLMVANGTIIQTHTVTLQPKLEETDAEVLSFAIAQLRSRLNSTAQEIIIPFSIDYPDPGVTLKVPRSGNRKKLLALAEKNARFFGEEVRRKKSLHIQEKTIPAANEVLVQVQEDLQLPETPLHIECFDNSHFQGSYPVSAMVCFKNGLPSKSDYRRFNTKDVQGINDVAAMKEVVFRRYRRLLDEQQPLPQLIIIDGGKGQLNAAMESIATLGLTGRMTVVGLAKNQEELFFPGDVQPLRLDYQNESLKLIRRIRDEVHRFGITFHRKKRSQGVFRNELEEIKGIGKATAASLLQTFRSVNKIRALTEDELAAQIGKSKARLIRNYFIAQAKRTPSA